MQKKLMISLLGLKKLELFAALLTHHGVNKDVMDIIDDVDLVFGWAFPDEDNEQQRAH